MDKVYSLSGRKLVGKVLIIEDDPEFGPWLQNKLKKTGLTVFLAPSFEEGMAAFEKELFHAVVSDIFLGDEPKGLDIVKAIEKTGTPTIIMSSAADLKIAKEAMNHGASYLLEKPFEVEELFKTLEKLWEEPKGLQAMVERFLDLNGLTPKEKEVVRLLLKGLSNKEIASMGDNSDRTIKFHLTSIFEKCGVKSRTELINVILPT